MEQITQKQYDYLRSLKNKRWSVELETQFKEFAEQGWKISKAEASKLIEKYLEAPLKQDSPEWKQIVQEKRALAEAEALRLQQVRDEARAKEEAECERCQDGHPIPHFNCSFEGRVGHTRHCSADICL